MDVSAFKREIARALARGHSLLSPTLELDLTKATTHSSLSVRGATAAAVDRVDLATITRCDASKLLSC